MAILADPNEPAASKVPECSGALVALLKVAFGQEQRVRCSEALERFLYEEYAADQTAWKRRVYYALKPLIPRKIQIILRQRYATYQTSRRFPAWPIETRVLDLFMEAVKGAVSGADQSPLYAIAPWPAGTRFAFCISHDVEGDAGLRRAPALLEVEQRVGVVSSWNLVPERYPIDWGIVNDLRFAGSEIGIHGLKHDGKLFQSKHTFSRRLRKIEEYARAWGAVGFRSPSCLRNAEWMKLMSFEYDLSFPDTDPYEPQPGGCCSVWPYFLGNMVELPLTMPQDHTLYEILGHTDLGLWDRKADWIESVGGLVLINVHPDYMETELRLQQYESFLRRMTQRAAMFHALPKDVARWWRDRHMSRLEMWDGKPAIVGAVAARGVAIQLGLEAAGFTGMVSEFREHRYRDSHLRVS
jgi:hypothetical protein